MEAEGYGYGCLFIGWDMRDGVTVHVAHNYRSHALLFRLVTHPKDTPPSYHHFGPSGLVAFSEVDPRSSTIHSCGVPLDERLTSVGLEICDAIHTLGPLLDGRPTAGLRIDLRDRDRMRRFTPTNNLT